MLNKILDKIACFFKHDWRMAFNKNFRHCCRCGKRQQYIPILDDWFDVKK